MYERENKRITWSSPNQNPITKLEIQNPPSIKFHL